MGIERRRGILGAAFASLALAAPAGATDNAWGEVAEWVARPYERNQFDMVFDSNRGVTVLFGGCCSGQGLFRDTWEWDGELWRQRTLDGPHGRQLHAMAYDSARGRTVLFGGWDIFDSLGDTWEWDGESWLEVATTGPERRNQHAMSYDSGRGVVVLFGGSTDATLYGDTWEWDGSIWTEVANTGPTPRHRHTMAYDSSRGVVVLFGGQDDVSGILGDTWEWDGQDWTLRSTVADGPPARYATHSLAYDSNRGVTVLFGGHYPRRDDTWEWDGTSWTEVELDVRPPARAGHGLAYDSVRDVVVTYGGFDNGWLDDTWEFGVDGDADGISDTGDNCPLDANGDQLDADLDGTGDVCDATFDTLVLQVLPERTEVGPGESVPLQVRLVNNDAETRTFVVEMLHVPPGQTEPVSWDASEVCLPRNPLSIGVSAGQELAVSCSVEPAEGTETGTHTFLFRLGEMPAGIVDEVEFPLEVLP